MQTIVSDRESVSNDFQVISKFLKKSPIFTCSFLVNINTSSTQLVNNPAISVLKFSKTKLLLAVKTINGVAILELKNQKVIVLQQMLFENYKIEDGFIEVSLKFLPLRGKLKSKKKLELLIGYQNGSIVQYDIEEKKIIKEYNDNNVCFKNRMVSQIILDPLNPEIFLTLYADSTLIKYAINDDSLNENEYFKTKIYKFDMKTSFNRECNKFLYKHKDNDYLEKKAIFNLDMPELDYFYARNKSTESLNPLEFYKFNCNFISDMIISSHSFYKNINAQDSREGYTSTIILYVGYDGFLRIYDYFWGNPLLSFKSYYGGFNSLSISSDGHLIGLSGQNDEIIIFDLKSLRYINISGHRSFITCTYIFNLDDFIIRVISCSMDSCISICEFDERIFSFEDENERKEREKNFLKCPKKIIFNQLDKTNIKPIIIKKIVEEGIGNMVIIRNYIFISGYDGNVGIWNFMNESINLKKETEKEELEKENEIEYIQESSTDKEKSSDKKSTE